MGRAVTSILCLHAQKYKKAIKLAVLFSKIIKYQMANGQNMGKNTAKYPKTVLLPHQISDGYAKLVLVRSRTWIEWLKTR